MSAQGQPPIACCADYCINYSFTDPGQILAIKKNAQGVLQVDVIVGMFFFVLHLFLQVLL